MEREQSDVTVRQLPANKRWSDQFEGASAKAMKLENRGKIVLPITSVMNKIS